MSAEHADSERRADAAALVGAYRRFGKIGPVYQVVDVEDRDFVRICLVDSGRTARYPLVEVEKDVSA